MAKYPCRNCKYFNVCGDNMRTEPCAGRELKNTKKRKSVILTTIIEIIAETIAVLPFFVVLNIVW